MSKMTNDGLVRSDTRWQQWASNG